MGFLIHNRKKNNDKILGIAIIAIIALAVGFIAVSKANSIPTGPTFQTGFVQCGLTYPVSGQEGPGCPFNTITFPIPFNSPPTSYSMNFHCMLNSVFTPQPGDTADSFCARNVCCQGHGFSIFWYPINYLSVPNGTTWKNFPVNPTELFNNAGNEQFPQAFSQQTFQYGDFTVNCLVASSSANAILRPVFFDSRINKFEQLSALSGALDLQVGTQTFLCGIGTQTQVLDTGRQGLNASYIHCVLQGWCASPPALAIEGLGGNGAGDNPVFNQIVLNLGANTFVGVIPHIGNQFANPVITKTSMGYWVEAYSPLNGLGNLDPVFDWTACVC